MEKKILFSKVLAIAGTVLAGFPILATVATSIIGSAIKGTFLFDYLMPAELFLVALAGGLLLLWVALRVRLLRRPVIIGLVAACVFLAASQLTAVWSGLAHGDTEPAGFMWGLVIAFLVLYTAAVIELAVTGIVLTRKIFDQPNSEK